MPKKWCFISSGVEDQIPFIFLHFGIFSYIVYFAPPTDMETRLQRTYLRQTLKETTISRICYWFDSIEIILKKGGCHSVELAEGSKSRNLKSHWNVKE